MRVHDFRDLGLQLRFGVSRRVLALRFRILGCCG